MLRNHYNHILLAIVLVPLLACAVLAEEKRHVSGRTLPVDVIGPGVLDHESRNEKRTAIDDFSRIETLVQHGNLLCQKGDYAQSKSNFGKALLLYDKAERHDPKGFSSHLFDKAECLDCYADLLQKLNLNAESVQIRSRAQTVRQVAISNKSKIRSYSNGYARSGDLPSAR